MKSTVLILCLLAGVTLTLPPPGLAQSGSSSQIEMLSNLRSGSPQRFLASLETMKQNELARTLYHDLYRAAGSEPTSQMEASAKAKALGFVLIMGLDNELNTLPEAEYTDKLARLSLLLQNVSPEVSGVAEEFQWRAVELMQFCTAYDFYRGITASELPPAQMLLARFADNAVAEFTKPFTVRNNLSLKLAAAAGYAGIILQNTSISGLRRTPRQWLETAVQHIDETVWKYQSDDAGNFGYSEGPWYFRYAMMNLLPFFTALDLHVDGASLDVNGREIPSPLRDPRWLRLFDWIATLRMPDGTIPPFEDTYRETYFPELASVGGILPSQRHLAWPNYTSAWNPVPAARISSELARTFDGRVEYLISALMETGTQDALPLSAVMPDAGYAVFRGGWEPDAMYVALIGKHGLARTHRSPVGSGHKQANETAFILHAGGELLATEPGYHSSDERTPLIFADHHNVILVDGKGADSTSFGSFLFGVDAFMEHGVVAGNSGMVSIRTRYQEADITRHAAVLNGRYLVLADEASSVRTRTFTHQIHGNGSTSRGTFSAAYNEHTGMWTAGEMRLHAVVHDASGTVSHVTQERKHAPSSRRFDTHEAMYSSVRGQRAVFHTVLHAAHQAQDVQAYTVNPLEGVTLTHIRSAKDQLLSVVNGTDGSITLHTPVLGAVETDAFGLFSILETAGRPDSWMLDGGSFIRLDGRMLLSSSQSLHAALLMETDTWRLVTTSGKPADILLRVPFHVYDINGSGVRNWDLQGNTLTLSVDESSDVSITFSSMPTSTEDIQLQPERLEIHALYPQPLKAGTVGTLTVAYELPDATTVRVVLSDMLGRPLRILPVALLPAGIHHARFSVADIPPGVYNIHIESGHSGAHRRIVIQ